MIECVFTIDYEIHGNGEGSLAELVYEPALKLKEIFKDADTKFVVFAEVAEFEKILEAGTDPGIRDVQRQIAEFHQEGFEIALHLHPQWYNARHRNGRWELDYEEYNLCLLPKQRVAHIVKASLKYLRKVLQAPELTPLAFRAGNWLFQPTETLAEVLTEEGVKLDSSVFKGGLQQRHKLDYRPALRNGYFWRFKRNANAPDSTGPLLELPIYTRMVPFWSMLTAKRVSLQRKSRSAASKAPLATSEWHRLRDYLRWSYPLKFDFCRMTLQELVKMMEIVIGEDRATPDVYKPLVAIGHTKDLLDFETVRLFLAFLNQRSIRVATFGEVYQRCADKEA